MSQKIFVYGDASITFREGDMLMINATEMARAFGKKPAHWLQNDQTAAFLNALTEVRKINSENIVRVERGGSAGGATWMHEDVAMEFARWLDPRFAIWCNDRIKELVNHGVTVINPEQFLTPDNMIRAMEAIKKERAEKQAALDQLQLANQAIIEQAPQVEYYNKVLSSESLLTTTQVAQDLGMSAVSLNRKLAQKKIQWRVGGTWCLTSGYVNAGYAKLISVPYLDKAGVQQTNQQLKWTEKGRQFIASQVQ